MTIDKLVTIKDLTDLRDVGIGMLVELFARSKEFSNLGFLTSGYLTGKEINRTGNILVRIARKVNRGKITENVGKIEQIDYVLKEHFENGEFVLVKKSKPNYYAVSNYDFEEPFSKKPRVVWGS